jgi:hypothetical protein
VSRSGPVDAKFLCRVCGGPRKYASKRGRCDTCARLHRERCGCGGLRHDRAKRCTACFAALRASDPLWYLEAA